MTNWKQFIELYERKSPEEYIKMKTCSVDGCRETNCSFIDATNKLEIQFYCASHWRDKDKLKDIENRQTVARHT